MKKLIVLTLLLVMCLTTFAYAEPRFKILSEQRLFGNSQYWEIVRILKDTVTNQEYLVYIIRIRGGHGTASVSVTELEKETINGKVN